MDAVDIGKLTPQEEAAALGVNISVRDVSRRHWSSLKCYSFLILNTCICPNVLSNISAAFDKIFLSLHKILDSECLTPSGL